MAQAALSYQQPQRRTYELDYPMRTPLRVLPGTAPRTGLLARLAPHWRAIFAVSIVVILMFGALSIVRVGLADATMLLFSQSAQISQSIEAERAAGARLEMQYSLATNPSVIQEAAAQLGMVADPQIDYLHILVKE